MSTITPDAAPTSKKSNIAAFDFEKVKIAFCLLLIAAFMTAVGNFIQTHVKHGLKPISFTDSVIGALVIFGVAMVGYVISQLPYLKKLSPVFWVGIIAVIMSTPIFPGHGFINSTTGVIQFAALGTPTLAFAGLALGKDLPQLKAMSWRIILVGLAVISGTFILGAIAGEILLRLEGII